MKKLLWHYEKDIPTGRIISGSHRFQSVDGHHNSYRRGDLANIILELIEGEADKDSHAPQGAIFIVSEDSPEYALLMKREEE